jgi:two-component system, NarL family, sensor histidine kinase UhpB
LRDACSTLQRFAGALTRRLGRGIDEAATAHRASARALWNRLMTVRAPNGNVVTALRAFDQGHASSSLSRPSATPTVSRVSRVDDGVSTPSRRHARPARDGGGPHDGRYAGSRRLRFVQPRTPQAQPVDDATGASRPVVAEPRGRTRNHVRVLASRRSLAWRVFLTNAAVLVGVSAFYALSPATISSPVVLSEALVLVVAIVVTLLVNLLLLERAFSPLDELRRLMQAVDPLRPGRRVKLERADADVAALADAFNAMLDRLETERRESARRALGAQEEERQRVARELHDELGQVLTGVLLLMDEASRAPAQRAAEALEEGREAARDAITEVRRIVADLRPEALDDLGLASALAALSSSFERRSGIRVERRIPSYLTGLSSEQDLVLYRAAQEALTNVARHARADHAELLVERIDGEVRMVVRDDGCGFAGEPPEDRGINGIRERAMLVGGTVDVNSTLGEGTRVVVCIPVQER